jgi:hypothetical protein
VNKYVIHRYIKSKFKFGLSKLNNSLESARIRTILTAGEFAWALKRTMAAEIQAERVCLLILFAELDT